MYTMTQGYKKKTYGKNLFSIITALALALFLLSSSVKIILNARFIYYFDMDHLNIPQSVNMDKSVVKKNYDILIDYQTKNSIPELNFPDFKMSPQGKIHFEEVRNLFNLVDYLLYGSLAVSIIGIVVGIRNRNLKFLKGASIFMILIPAVLAVPFAVDFNWAFTKFHQIAFSNNYWLFDPNLDPIINILPENFFMHEAIGILMLLSLFSISCYLLYRRFNKKEASLF